jgi:hypothetical protein
MERWKNEERSPKELRESNKNHLSGGHVEATEMGQLWCLLCSDAYCTTHPLSIIAGMIHGTA